MGRQVQFLKRKNLTNSISFCFVSFRHFVGLPYLLLLTMTLISIWQAKQLKDYENAVIAKRLEELDDDEIQALVEEIDRDDF